MYKPNSINYKNRRALAHTRKTRKTQLDLETYFNLLEREDPESAREFRKQIFIQTHHDDSKDAGFVTTALQEFATTLKFRENAKKEMKLKARDLYLSHSDTKRGLKNTGKQISGIKATKAAPEAKEWMLDSLVDPDAPTSTRLLERARANANSNPATSLSTQYEEPTQLMNIESVAEALPDVAQYRWCPDGGLKVDYPNGLDKTIESRYSNTDVLAEFYNGNKSIMDELLPAQTDRKRSKQNTAKQTKPPQPASLPTQPKSTSIAARGLPNFTIQTGVDTINTDLAHKSLKIETNSYYGEDFDLDLTPRNQRMRRFESDPDDFYAEDYDAYRGEEDEFEKDYGDQFDEASPKESRVRNIKTPEPPKASTNKDQSAPLDGTSDKTAVFPKLVRSIGSVSQGRNSFLMAMQPSSFNMSSHHVSSGMEGTHPAALAAAASAAPPNSSWMSQIHAEQLSIIHYAQYDRFNLEGAPPEFTNRISPEHELYIRSVASRFDTFLRGGSAPTTLTPTLGGRSFNSKRNNDIVKGGEEFSPSTSLSSLTSFSNPSTPNLKASASGPSTPLGSRGLDKTESSTFTFKTGLWNANATPSVNALRESWASFQVNHYLQSQETALLHRSSPPLSHTDAAMIVHTIGNEDPLWCLRLLELGALDAPNNPRAVVRRYLATLAFLSLSDQPLVRGQNQREIQAARNLFGIVLNTEGRLSASLPQNGSVPNHHTAFSTTHIHIPLVLAALGPVSLASLYMYWPLITGQPIGVRQNRRLLNAKLSSASESSSDSKSLSGQALSDSLSPFQNLRNASSRQTPFQATTTTPLFTPRSARTLTNISEAGPNCSQEDVIDKDQANLPPFNTLAVSTMLSTPCVFKISMDAFRKVRPPQQIRSPLTTSSPLSQLFSLSSSSVNPTTGLRTSLFRNDKQSSSGSSHYMGSFSKPLPPPNTISTYNTKQSQPGQDHEQGSGTETQSHSSQQISKGRLEQGDSTSSSSPITNRGSVSSLGTSVTESNTTLSVNYHSPEETLSRAALVVSAIELHPGPQLASSTEIYKKIGVLKAKLSEVRRNILTFLQGASSLLLRKYATPSTASLLVCLFDIDAYSGLLRLSGAQAVSQTKTVKELIIMLQSIPPSIASSYPLGDEKRKSSRNSNSRVARAHSVNKEQEANKASDHSGKISASLASSMATQGGNSKENNLAGLSGFGLSQDEEDDLDEDEDYDDDEDNDSNVPGAAKELSSQVTNPPAFKLFTRTPYVGYNPIYVLRAARERRAMVSLRDEILSNREELLSGIVHDEAIAERALENIRKASHVSKSPSK